MSKCGETIAVEVRSFPGHVVESDRRVKSVGEGLFRYVDGPVQVVFKREIDDKKK
jgi:hypothetical protein